MPVRPSSDLLALLGSFTRERNISLRDPQSLEAFLAAAKPWDRSGAIHQRVTRFGLMRMNAE